jgi:DNA-binding NtrC family response regulator
MNEPNPFVYVVDDDPGMRASLKDLIGSAGLNVHAFGTAQEFLGHATVDGSGCLVLDVQLPGLSGLDLQQELTRRKIPMPIIFITGHGDIPMSVRAMKAGAIEFLTKPFRDEDLLNAVEQALARGVEKASESTSPVGETESSKAVKFAEIVGQSAGVRRVLKDVEIVAPTDSTALILGETGTGKELIARAIHNLSLRRSSPFVKLNCAAIPTGLLESELFGHEKGAFTGAIAQRIGRFELANNGTIFLDEIGDIPLELQPKLLRVLQEREFERLGSTRTLHSGARLIAATNVNLENKVNEKRFRSDLYYRLNVFPIVIPPLRERRDDIPVLVDHFVRKFRSRMKKEINAISDDAMKAMLQYDWPGNVRELENVIERAVILSRSSALQISLSDLPEPNNSSAANANNQPTTLRDAGREHILRTLKEAKWIIGGPTGAAARLGMKRTTLQSLVKRLRINRPGKAQFSSPDES